MKTLLLRISLLKDEKGKGVNAGTFKAILNPINTSNKTNVLNGCIMVSLGKEGRVGRRERKGRGENGLLLPAVNLP